jgi:Protein of unknown function (DUF732)
MSSITMYRPWTLPTLRRPMLVRQVGVWVDVINVAAAVLRPLLVSAGIVTAVVVSPPPAHADPLDGSITNTLNNVGIGNNGPISTALAGIGQSICPMLVQPGATFASTAAQMSGNNGLTPQIAGWVTSMAIQMECPGVMTSLANGNLPFPLQMPGANPAAPGPFQLPGVNPPPPNPFQVPGL